MCVLWKYQRAEIRVCLLFGSTFRECSYVRRVSFSGCLALSCSALPEQTLLSDDQMLWGPGLPYHCHLAFLFWLASLSPSILITMKSSRYSLGVFYLWDLLAYGKSLTSFLWTVFYSQVSSSGFQRGSDLSHLSLAKTSGSLLPDSTPLTESLSYDILIPFSVLRNPLH